MFATNQVAILDPRNPVLGYPSIFKPAYYRGNLGRFTIKGLCNPLNKFKATSSHAYSVGVMKENKIFLLTTAISLGLVAAIAWKADIPAA